MMNKVVVTGYGVLSPLGNEMDTMWEHLIAGCSGVGPITRFDVTDQQVKIAAELKDFVPTDYLPRKEVRRMDPCSHYAMAAAMKAAEHAKLDVNQLDRDRFGVSFGTGQGGMVSLTEQLEIFNAKGPRRVSPFCVPMMIANMPAGHVGIHFGARGPNITLTTACAASAHAIGEASRILQRGDADVMISGGTEAGLVPISLAGFSAMKALSTRNDEPEKASRPFDKDRDGFVIGEGAAMVILETLEHARERGAKIYGELLGYGLSSDGYHITAPPEDGDGGVRSMREALRDAGIAPSAVDCINAHGTSTPTGDVAESRAIETVFGDHAWRLPITATKSMTGHLLGAAGALESVISLLSIETGIIPPTINLDMPGEDCRLDYVPKVARESEVNVVLTNSFGFGGQNASLIWGRFTP